MMDAIEKYYFKLEIEIEIEKYEENYDSALINRDWLLQKITIGDYEETIKKAKISLGENSELVKKLRSKLKKMEIPPLCVIQKLRREVGSGGGK